MAIATRVVQRPVEPPPTKIKLELSEQEAAELYWFLYSGGDWPRSNTPKAVGEEKSGAKILNNICGALTPFRLA